MPLLVAASACWEGSGLRAYAWPPTSTVRFCGGGGFVFGRRAGGFPFGLDDYHTWLTAMRRDVAACLDLPCEAEIATDEAEVARRQRSTLEAAGVVLSGRRPRQEPQIIYVVSEPEPHSGLGCLLPVIVIGLVLFVVQ